MRELHLLHSALTVLYNSFPSEEDFWRKIGFFRENAIDLAKGFATAVRESTETSL